MIRKKWASQTYTLATLVKGTSQTLSCYSLMLNLFVRTCQIVPTLKGAAATPMQKTFTETEIRENVQMYQDRIKEAQLRLAGLPASVATYNERKRLQAQRRALNQDIEHIKGLIRIAEAAL